MVTNAIVRKKSCVVCQNAGFWVERSETFASMAASFPSPIICKATTNNNHPHALDSFHVRRAAEIADKSAGFTSPHPNFGCVIATAGKVVGEGYLYAQGTKPAEVQAVEAAGELCRGATAYLNMEPGDCHGDRTAVSALVKVWPRVSLCLSFLFECVCLFFWFLSILHRIVQF